MRRARANVFHSLVAAFVTVTSLSACAGGVNASTPTSGTAAQPLPDANVHTGSNPLAGQYSGSAVDTVFGTGKLKASFAQSDGAVGGSIATTYQTASMTSSLAGTYAKSSIAGVEIATINKVACAFSYTGKYDSSTHTLSIGYHAVHGCKGESGTLTLNKQCFYEESLMQPPGETPALRLGLSPDAGGLHGC